MPSDALTAIYRAHPAMRKLFDWILSADVEDSRTTVEDLVEHCDMSRRHAINLLRALADGGYGEFKVGRKGHPSRFEWAEDPQALAEQLDEHVDEEPSPSRPINGELVLEMFPPTRPKPVPVESPAEPPESSERAELIEHSYVLRPKLRIAVQLPEDLTAREAEILGEWVRNLSFER